MHLNVLQENLAMLYLRLNGYFVSGFIVHARQSVKTQVDVLAVRFPHNSEPEREIPPSPYLQTSNDCIDFLICEVKSGRAELRFNKGLRENPVAIRTVLQWMGAFTQNEIDDLVEPVRQLLCASGSSQNCDIFHAIPCPREHQIRSVLFAPDRLTEPSPNEIRYVSGEELIGYIWKCLCPEGHRDKCGTRYDFGLWGSWEPIVRVFKDARRRSRPSMKDICGRLLGDKSARTTD
jgi:hypothetical protein